MKKFISFVLSLSLISSFFIIDNPDLYAEAKTDSTHMILTNSSMNKETPIIKTHLSYKKKKRKLKKSITVYVTRTGDKYHNEWCRHLRRSKIAMSLRDAKAQGYTACANCH